MLRSIDVMEDVTTGSSHVFPQGQRRLKFRWENIFKEELFNKMSKVLAGQAYRTFEAWSCWFYSHIILLSDHAFEDFIGQNYVPTRLQAVLYARSWFLPEPLTGSVTVFRFWTFNFLGISSFFSLPFAILWLSDLVRNSAGIWDLV